MAERKPGERKGGGKYDDTRVLSSDQWGEISSEKWRGELPTERDAHVNTSTLIGRKRAFEIAAKGLPPTWTHAALPAS